MSYWYLIYGLSYLGVFICGVVLGVYVIERGHRAGVKLMDRLKHDQVPFEAEEPNIIQTHTDGTFEEVG